MYVDDYSYNILPYLIFKCLICDSRSLKCVWGYGLGDFSVVWGCFGGVSMDPERINHLSNLILVNGPHLDPVSHG